MIAKAKGGRPGGEQPPQSLRSRRRWLTLMLVFVLIPVLLSLFFSVRFLHAESNARMEEFAQRSLDSLAGSLSFRLNSIEVMAEGIIMNLYDLLAENGAALSPAQEFDEFRAVSHLINRYGGRDLIDRIRLFVPDDKLYARQMDRFFPLSMLGEDIKARLDQGDSSAWAATYMRSSYYTGRSQQVLSYVVALKSTQDFDSLIGVLFVDLLETELHDLMQLGGDSADIYLLDASGVVISSRRQEEIGTVFAPAAASAQGLASDRGFIAGSGDSPQRLAYARVPGTLWYLLMPVPAGEMPSLISAASAPSGTILIIGLLLLLALTFLIIFSTALDISVRRINQIVYQLTAEGLGMPTGLKARRRKEVVPIASLEENVKNMAAMIQQMVEETYDAKISTRNAELKALQAQINPHFLYNTLATIKWVVLDGDSQKAAMLVDALSQYFRLSLNKGRDIVPLRDEYALIRKYLDIQLSRFPDKFLVDWDVDEGALDCLLPKLSLQPIVENALQHGLRDWPTGAGRILIAIRQKGEDVTISISDNGVGMPEEKAKSILLSEFSGEGFGVKSVDTRIKLFFGEAYGVTIRSEEGKGTEVVIKISKSTQIQSIF